MWWRGYLLKSQWFGLALCDCSMWWKGVSAEISVVWFRPLRLQHVLKSHWFGFAHRNCSMRWKRVSAEISVVWFGPLQLHHVVEWVSAKISDFWFGPLQLQHVVEGGICCNLSAFVWPTAIAACGDQIFIHNKGSRQIVDRRDVSGKEHQILPHCEQE
jgi:hypothetical protein